MDPILTREAFIAWLQSKEPDDSVGNVKDPHSCPLATYLREKTGNECDVTNHVYYNRSIGFFEEGHSGRLPSWAQGFVLDVDALASDRPKPLVAAVTASQALSLLQ